MKKKLLAIFLTIALIGGTVGCSGAPASNEGGDNETETTTDTETDSEGDSVTPQEATSDETVSIMIWDSFQEPGISEILDGFTQKTGIKTELQVVKWDEYWTLLSAGAEGGTLPDVFWMHSNESERYMSNDMLLDVTEKIEESTEIDPENYPDDIWGLYTHDDKYFAVPKDIDTVALWYNKALFDDAGVEYPTADWTWDDVYEAAKKLTKEDGSVYGYCNPNNNNQAGYYNMIFGRGGYIISDDKKSSGYDDPKTIEAMQLMEKFIVEGLMPSQEIMSESEDVGLFQSGKVAMLPQGSWMLAAYKGNEYTAENADVVELPKDSETGRRVSIYNGLGYAIAANTKVPDEAWAMVEYLGSEEGQKKQAELGVTMSAYKGTSDMWINSAPQFNLQAYLNMQEDMVIRPYSRNTIIWEDAASEWFKKAWMQEITMEEACRSAAEDMNNFLAEE